MSILEYFYFIKAHSFGHLKEKSMISQFKMTKNWIIISTVSFVWNKNILWHKKIIDNLNNSCQSVVWNLAMHKVTYYDKCYGQ